MTQSAAAQQRAAQERLDVRLSELEGLTTRINVESKSTRADIEKLTVSFDRFAGEVTNWMRHAGRPNVGWLLGGASLVITVLSLAAAPFLRDLHRVETSVQKLTDNAHVVSANRWTRTDQEGFRAQVEVEFEKVQQALRDGDQALGESLQREMRLRDEAFHRDVRTLLDAPAEKIQSIQRDLAKLEAEVLKRGDWIRTTDTERAEADARYDAQLGEIQRQIAEISSEQRRRTSKVYTPEN